MKFVSERWFVGFWNASCNVWWPHLVGWTHFCICSSASELPWTSSLPWSHRRCRNGHNNVKLSTLEYKDISDQTVSIKIWKFQAFEKLLKWNLAVSTTYLTPRILFVKTYFFCIKLLHAHLQYVCNVSSKSWKDPMKALRGAISQCIHYQPSITRCSHGKMTK